MRQPFPAEDPARWPLSKFVREFLPRHLDGRIVSISFALNWGAGVLSALMVLARPDWLPLGWVDVLFFSVMPVLGFIVFCREALRHREHWQVLVDVAIQLLMAALPWIAVVRSFAGTMR